MRAKDKILVQKLKRAPLTKVRCNFSILWKVFETILRYLWLTIHYITEYLLLILLQRKIGIEVYRKIRGFLLPPPRNPINLSCVDLSYLDISRRKKLIFLEKLWKRYWCKEKTGNVHLCNLQNFYLFLQKINIFFRFVKLAVVSCLLLYYTRSLRLLKLILKV